MKKELKIILNGMGYYTISERRRKVLSVIFVASLVIHVVGLAVFGGIKIMSGMREEKTVFVAPPPVRKYEPRKLEHKVKVQKRQRSSSRPSMVPRMVAMRKSQLALPEIKMNPKIIKTSFQPKFKAVSGKGLGAGLGTGYGLGGFGAGVSSFNFFGIRGRGDKIAVLVDVSVSMVEEQRGGPDGFARVKNRIYKVIDALSEQAMFNVVAFADAAEQWKDEMVISNDEHKGAAKLFVRPFNVSGNWGLTHGNVRSSRVPGSVPALGGTTRLDLALTSAFENSADTILIISDGLPRVKKGMTSSERAAIQAQRQRWKEENAERLQSWQQAEAQATYTTEKVWVPPQPARPAKPPPKGPPKEGQVRKGTPARPAVPGHWKTVRRKQGGAGTPRPKPPEFKTQYWNLTDFIKHLDALYEQYYKKKGKPKPVIHAIGYQIDDKGGNFLKELARHYKGKYRRVARIK